MRHTIELTSVADSDEMDEDISDEEVTEIAPKDASHVNSRAHPRNVQSKVPPIEHPKGGNLNLNLKAQKHLYVEGFYVTNLMCVLSCTCTSEASVSWSRGRRWRVRHGAEKEIPVERCPETVQV